MEFSRASNTFYLNKSTYVNLRWIAIIGQLITILSVQFVLNFEFNYFYCLTIVTLSILSNILLILRFKENQLNNFVSTIYLSFDIMLLGFLFYLTGGITNPFVFLIIVPAVFSSQYLNIYSSILLVSLIILILIIITFYYLELPHPGELHFHAPDYYLIGIPVSIVIGLLFLVYFGVKFGEENRIRKRAYDKIQELMAKENELISLGAQSAAAAHSLGTPLSTILLTAKELQKEFGKDTKIKKDLDLLISQSNRCREILKKLSMKPKIDDNFLEENLDLHDYLKEIIRSYEEISNKKFTLNFEEYRIKLKISKSSEIIYGLRNFIGNANKFSKDKIEIFLKSNNSFTEIIVKDDGPGFPKDLIEKHKLGEPYIRSANQENISKYGLGLGTFIGKTLLEKNFANIIFQNSKYKNGAEVLITWKNKDLKNI